MSSSNSMTAVNAILDELTKRRHKNIVVFTGAGMSAESGIPTFRSGNNAFWGKYKPADLATPQGWRKQKEVVWAWYESRRHMVAGAQPNPGHAAITELQRRTGAAVITQNVDDLHERAGALDVLHLHGSLFAARCYACGEPHTLEAPIPVEVEELTPPRCMKCQGYVRPGVVWFGEDLDRRDFGRAERLIKDCDLLLVIGTSGVVYPAAGLVPMAPQSATLIEINPEPATQTNRIHRLEMPAATGMTMLLEPITRSHLGNP